MKKVTDLLKKLDKARKTIKVARDEEFSVIDELHASILQEILKSGLLTKMQWYVPHCKYNYIDQLDAQKDDTWKKIEKMLDQSEKVTWSARAVSLNDNVCLDITGGIISLLPRERMTKVEREGPRPPMGNELFVRHMAKVLFDFVKEHKLNVDFDEIVKAKNRVIDDLDFLNSALEFGKELKALTGN